MIVSCTRLFVSKWALVRSPAGFPTEVREIATQSARWLVGRWLQGVKSSISMKF
jgi:hypothetical protein